jgi:predicted hydrocarbon binding protein
MLSAFLKKLLFARQFNIANGSIEVLGTSQVMLPSDVVVALQTLDEKRYYDVIKSGVKNNLDAYMRKVGSTSEGSFQITSNIFETFGIGKPEVVILDQKRKSATVRFHNPPVAAACQETHLSDCVLLPAALAGMFSSLFGKDVDCDIKKCSIKGELCEYVVK